MSKLTRRQMMERASGLITAAATGISCEKQRKKLDSKESATALAGAPTRRPKFLFVYTASGGASINDSFMALKHSESQNYKNINAYPDRAIKQFDGTDLRAVDIKMDHIGPLPFPVDGRQSQFLKKHKNDIMVCSVEHSSVSHPIGQKASITGNNAWNGRTLQEAVAMQYGRDLPIPHVNMGEGGFAEHGTDPSVPAFARAEFVKNPAFFPLAMHGSLGIQGAPKKSLIDLARNFRRDRIESASPFFKNYVRDARLNTWIRQRLRATSIEKMNLINSLNPFEDSTDLPFKDFGLTPNERGEFLRDIFDNIGADVIQTQALLAYLLVVGKVSNVVTFGPGMNVLIDPRDIDDPLLINPPGGFDYSHNGHRGSQGVCWQQCLSVIDKLIELLKRSFYPDGTSLWQDSLIYIATEHGKDKTRVRAQEEFTTGHNFNNGVTIISPMVNGGKVLGGVDPETGLTYGFNPLTGEPEKGRTMTERDIYSGILQAMGVDTAGSGLPDMKAMVRRG